MTIRTFWDKYIKTDPVWAFVCNFLLMLVIYSLCRVFFFLANTSYFPDVTFARFLILEKGGLQFDISAIIYTNLLYMVMQLIPFRFRLNKMYQTIAKWIFIVTNAFIIIFNCIDVVFFRFTNRRTTGTIFSEFQHEDNILKILLSGLVDYWYVTLFAFALIFIVYKLYYTPKPFSNNRDENAHYLKTAVVYYFFRTLLFCAFIFLAVVGIRGGIGAGTRPISMSNANQYVEKSAETAVVLNTPFCVIRTMNKKTYKNPRYFNDAEEMETIYTPIHYPEPAGEFRSLNVIIFIVESFGKEYSGFLNPHLDNGNYKGFTPFLDSLYAEGLTFKYSYSNGRKSIDAMPSILSSIPMFIEPYIVTPYSTNDVSSIADVLKEKGYYSAFFHGAPNGSMGFQAYAKSAGFDDYFGLNEYGNKNLDGMWAVWDEEFLQYYADEMGKLKQPFVTAVFTATSHHPFRIPKRYEGKFPEGTQPIHKCVAYTDYAIEQFFKTMSQYDWFDNTLFVITADHTNQTQHEEYFTDLNLYSIPILFYHPGSDLKGMDTIPAQQIDIMPSILSYLNYDKPYFAFGQDLIHNKERNKKFAVNYNNQIYQFIQGDYFLQFDGEKVKSVYNYKTDRLLQHDLAGKPEKQMEMETFLKSIIQQYIVRMTDDQLKMSEPEF